MRKRVHIALAVLLVILAGVMAWLGLRLREPVYQGKPLSGWLEILHREKLAHLDDRAMQAIRHIGTNALPVLIERLRAHDTPLKQLIMKWAQKQAFVHFHFNSADERRPEAIWGYEALGPLASAQVPSLSATLTNDPSPKVRIAAAWALGYIGPEARMAAPALFRATQDKDYHVRGPAFVALGKVRPNPQLTIPLLVAGLDDPHPTVRFDAAFALGNYGTQAKAAIPTLLRMLATNNAAVLEHDTNVFALYAISAGNAAGFEKDVVGSALKKIDPEAAAKAGVK
jgi:HEAT repeat protein